MDQIQHMKGNRVTIQITQDPTSPTGVTSPLGHIENPPDDPTNPWPAVTLADPGWVDDLLIQGQWEYVDSRPETSAHPDLEAMTSGDKVYFRWATNPTDVSEYQLHDAEMPVGLGTLRVYLLEKI